MNELWEPTNKTCGRSYTKQLRQKSAGTSGQTKFLDPYNERVEQAMRILAMVDTLRSRIDTARELELINRYHVAREQRETDIEARNELVEMNLRENHVAGGRNPRRTSSTPSSTSS